MFTENSTKIYVYTENSTKIYVYTENSTEIYVFTENSTKIYTCLLKTALRSTCILKVALIYIVIFPDQAHRCPLCLNLNFTKPKPVIRTPPGFDLIKEYNLVLLRHCCIFFQYLNIMNPVVININNTKFEIVP